MARYLFAIFLFVVSISAVVARPADHVILVSIDGLRPEFYREQSWPAPTLQQLAREGVQAHSVLPPFPSVTYPAHTTIVTGASPARHCIDYNSPFEPKGATGRWYWEAEAICAKTLWQVASANRLTTASIGWPVTVGATIDYLFPEIWSLESGVGTMAPIRAHARPEGLVEELERNATGPLSNDNFTLDHMVRDIKIAEIAGYLLERHRPALMFVHLVQTDHYQHDEGRDGPMTRRSVANADSALGLIVETITRLGLTERTALIITGDHGFINRQHRYAPNVRLVEAGLLENRPDRGNWRAAFLTTGAAAFLHLRDRSDRAALDEVTALLDGLPTSEKQMFTVLNQDQLASLGAAPAAALALAPRPGIDMVARTDGPVVSAANGGQHGYMSEHAEIHTGFVGYGAGFAQGQSIQSMRLEDIAPLVAHLLELPFEAPDGRLNPSLLAVDQ